MANPTPNIRFPFRLFFLLFSAIALLIFAGAWYVGSAAQSHAASGRPRAGP